MPVIDVHTHLLNRQWLALLQQRGPPNKLMCGSDFPHNLGDMKGCLARVDALPAAHVKAVRSANAERIFRL